MTNKSIVVNYPGRKGAGAVIAYEMTKGLIENGCRVYAVIAKDIENIERWKSLNLDKLYLLPTYSNKYNFVTNTLKFWLLDFRKLKRKFADITIDTIYVPMIQPWTPLVNRVFPEAKTIVTVHDPQPHSGSNNRVFNWICSQVPKDADDIILLSETFRGYSADKFNKDPSRIHIIPHGRFDFYKHIQTNNAAINYDINKTNFLFFGRITQYKGLHTLARAYKKLLAQRSDISLTIVGEGDFSEYEQEYAELENVTIVNRWIKDEEVGTFFTGKNIVTVLPYTDATQSGVIPIAMEYKAVVIASYAGGLKEQIKDRVTGYLFEPKNADDLYRVMSYVCENVREKEKIIEQAYEFNNAFDWTTLAKKLIGII